MLKHFPFPDPSQWKVDRIPRTKLDLAPISMGHFDAAGDQVTKLGGRGPVSGKATGRAFPYANGDTVICRGAQNAARLLLVSFDAGGLCRKSTKRQMGKSLKGSEIYHRSISMDHVNDELRVRCDPF